MLYVCEFTLEFFKRRSQLLRHLAKLKQRHPPGEEIYRHNNVAMFEVGVWEGVWRCARALLLLDPCWWLLLSDIRSVRMVRLAQRR